MRLFALLFFITLLPTLSACSSKVTQFSKADKTTQRPNIVFILIDDMGWPDAEVYGHQFHETPNINKLAAEGIVFTDAYTASPVCSSTRASIQSGQYPARVGITDYIPGHMRPFEILKVPHNRTQYMPLDVITMGEVIRDAGYATGYIGKWHLNGFEKGRLPKSQGYDYAITRLGGAHFDFASKYDPPFEGLDKEDYLANVLTDRAINFIEKNKSRPFFLTLSHYAVHIPLQAEENLIEKYENKTKPASGVNNPIYAAMVEHVDQSVGRILDKLTTLELDKNTVVIFYSDNGGLIKMFNGNGPVVSTNAPLRSEKGSLYEGGVRVPFIVRWPNKIAPGTRTDALMTSTDLFPTLVNIAGGTLPQNQVIDGENLMNSFEGLPPQERAIYFHYPHYHHSVPAGAIREGDYKLIQFYDDMRIELYNLSKDIGEKNNLAEQQPKLAAHLLGKLSRWLSEVGAEMPTQNPNFDPARRYEWRRHPDHPAAKKSLKK